MPYIKIEVPEHFDQERPWKLVAGIESHDLKVWDPEYRNVLDHGYVGLVDFMGDDMAAVHAARTSYGKGTKKVSTDEGLVRYLMRHRHTTPFEMITFKWHVKAPIFVFRQWHRHRTASINEYSGRYSIIENDMYVPNIQNLKPQSVSNRQGRSDDDLSVEEYQAVMAAVDHVYDLAYET
jgi:thymidylate synthase (FAD)